MRTSDHLMMVQVDLLGARLLTMDLADLPRLTDHLTRVQAALIHLPLLTDHTGHMVHMVRMDPTVLTLHRLHLDSEESLPVVEREMSSFVSRSFDFSSLKLILQSCPIEKFFVNNQM